MRRMKTWARPRRQQDAAAVPNVVPVPALPSSANCCCSCAMHALHYAGSVVCKQKVYVMHRDVLECPSLDLCRQAGLTTSSASVPCASCPSEFFLRQITAVVAFYRGRGGGWSRLPHIHACMHAYRRSDTVVK